MQVQASHRDCHVRSPIDTRKVCDTEGQAVPRTSFQLTAVVGVPEEQSLGQAEKGHGKPKTSDSVSIERMVADLAGQSCHGARESRVMDLMPVSGSTVNVSSSRNPASKA